MPFKGYGIGLFSMMFCREDGVVPQVGEPGLMGRFQALDSESSYGE